MKLVSFFKHTHTHTHKLCERNIFRLRKVQSHPEKTIHPHKERCLNRSEQILDGNRTSRWMLPLDRKLKSSILITYPCAFHVLSNFGKVNGVVCDEQALCRPFTGTFQLQVHFWQLGEIVNHLIWLSIVKHEDEDRCSVKTGVEMQKLEEVGVEIYSFSLSNHMKMMVTTKPRMVSWFWTISS